MEKRTTKQTLELEKELKEQETLLKLTNDTIDKLNIKRVALLTKIYNLKKRLNGNY